MNLTAIVYMLSLKNHRFQSEQSQHAKQTNEETNFYFFQVLFCHFQSAIIIRNNVRAIYDKISIRYNYLSIL